MYVCVWQKHRLITFFLVQHSERLHQLMFGTLYQSQPGFAFLLKRSEQTKKKKWFRVQTGQQTLEAHRGWRAGGHTVAEQQSLKAQSAKTVSGVEQWHVQRKHFQKHRSHTFMKNSSFRRFTTPAQKYTFLLWWFSSKKYKAAAKFFHFTWEWKALCRSASLCRWTTSGMTSFLSRRPCWGLFCKQWSSDPRPSPEWIKQIWMKKLHLLCANVSKEALKTSSLFPLTFPSPVLTSTSTAYTSCTSNSAFSWSFLQKRGRQKSATDHIWRKCRKGGPTFAGLSGSGWWFSLHRWHVAWADGTACL